MTVFTDNRAVSFIKQWKGTNARWYLAIDDAFGRASIRFIRGKENVVADCLSRMLRTGVELIEVSSQDDRNEILSKVHHQNGHMGEPLLRTIATAIPQAENSL